MLMVVLVFLTVIEQNGVGYWPMGNYLNWAVVCSQLLIGYLVRLMVKKCSIHACYSFNIRSNGAQIVRYHKNGHLLVQLTEHFVKFALKFTINIGIGLIQNKYLRVRYQRAAKQRPLQLPTR